MGIFHLLVGVYCVLHKAVILGRALVHNHACITQSCKFPLLVGLSSKAAKTPMLCFVTTNPILLALKLFPLNKSVFSKMG